MAVYKVPQDVEADDKLIGPFSFRQFVYLIIVVVSGAVAWGLAQIFIGLAIIPLPIILLFGALALPLRKDQPMEIYLAAIVSFYIKPHKRLWDPDGIESMIEISAPKTVDEIQTKHLTTEDAEERFSYLANLVDSQGWAIRGAANGGAQGSPLNSDAFLEAQSAQDVLDTGNSVAKGFDTMMAERTQALKAEARAHMFQPAIPAPTPAPTAPASVPEPYAGPSPVYNPYPEFHQAMVQPVNDQAHVYQHPEPAATPEPAPQSTQTEPQSTPAPQPQNAPAEPAEQPAAKKSDDTAASTTSDNGVSPDIMNLANNSDLSIETLAREAHRLSDKKASEMAEEVVISLR